MVDEATVNKFAKRQIRAFPWGFIIVGIINIIMGLIFMVFFGPILSMNPFFSFDPTWFFVIGIVLIVAGVILRYLLYSLGKKTGAEYSMPTDEEPTASSTPAVQQEHPASFVLLPKKSLQRLGLRLLIYSIVGVIVSYIFPWALILGPGKIINYTLETSDGKFLANTASSSIDNAAVYYQDAVGIVIGAFVLVLLLGISLMVTGILQSNFLPLSRRFALVNIILGFGVLLGGVYLLIGTIRILSLHLFTIPQNSQFNFGDPSLGLFPVAYVTLVFGILFIRNSLRAIHGQQRYLEPQPIPGTAPQKGTMVQESG